MCCFWVYNPTIQQFFWKRLLFLMHSYLCRTEINNYVYFYGASIFQGDVQKVSWLSRLQPNACSSRFHTPGRLHSSRLSSDLAVILQGPRSCDAEVWRPLIAGMAWAMTSANSFIAGPARRDRIRLQRFLWAQQWPSRNKLAGFSTLGSTPTRIIAEPHKHSVCAHMDVSGRMKRAQATKKTVCHSNSAGLIRRCYVTGLIKDVF